MVRALMLLMVSAAVLAGCARKPPPQPDTFEPASMARLQQMRRVYEASSPDARLGLVIAINKEVEMIGVGDVNGQEFRPGDVVTFIDSRNRPIGTGTVVRVFARELHIKYDRPTASGRLPREGDVMVRFRQNV
jgi:hypothetical protein